MFGMGWSELALVGIVALIVVGPKDLPVLFRQGGRMMGRARGMAREFTQAMNAAAEDTGLRDVERTMRAASDPRGFGVDAIRDAIKDPVTKDPVQMHPDEMVPPTSPLRDEAEAAPAPQKPEGEA